jgi:uncharacterized lipoprotein YddW (UPF0748 family)
VELRGTWLTTTANRALATPADTAASMRRLAEIGLNTVYVESWKNGYTQFPSRAMEQLIGVAQRPALAQQDPSDGRGPKPARDLLEETLIEAHRQGLHHVAWFEYGFMAAHASTQNHLRRQFPHWLSRNREGGEVAPNGFVWLNPLVPEVRRLLLDITLEAIHGYDLDGVQFDDRIVWPYITMGYDDFTRRAFAAEHNGREPPNDPREPGWVRWRADKLDALAREFTAALRAALPGRVLSLSPATFPWSFENYLLNWPAWGRWPEAERWTEFVPQAYRFSYEAFERTWREQEAALQTAGSHRAKELVAGIRINGDGRNDSSWLQLRQSIELVRQRGHGGHSLWFSKGVLESYPAELQALYASAPPAQHPAFPSGWRARAQPLVRVAQAGEFTRWALGPTAEGQPPARPRRYRVIGHDGQRWQYVADVEAGALVAAELLLPHRLRQAELLVDRRGEVPWGGAGGLR